MFHLCNRQHNKLQQMANILQPETNTLNINAEKFHDQSENSMVSLIIRRILYLFGYKTKAYLSKIAAISLV